MMKAFQALSCALLWMAVGLVGVAQEQLESKDANQPIANTRPKDPPPGSAESFTGRLPRFFSGMVDAKQRAEIYAIQRSFYAQRQELERQLAAIKQAELEATQAVLTAEQQERLAELRALSAAKSKPGGPASSPSAESSPASTKPGANKSTVTDAADTPSTAGIP